MRVVVVGAGAVGGAVGARLALAGVPVHLVARGPHLAALRDRGLVLRSPDGEATVHPPASTVDQVRLVPGDVVLLAVKSHGTAGVLAELAPALADAPDVPVVCVQNGVANEREALRRARRVYGVCVLCPTLHLEPGVVVAYSSPSPGVLDVGRYPDGTDDVAAGIAAAFRAGGFDSNPVPDVMRWKHGKLLTNLANAVEAVCGPDEVAGPLARLAREEGEAVLRAAGVPFTSAEEDAARRAGLVSMRPVGGEDRPGGSSWQSLARGLGSVETDYLNGEVVLLARQHGVPAPVNEVLARLAVRMAARREPPGSVPAADVLAMAGR